MVRSPQNGVLVHLKRRPDSLLSSLSLDNFISRHVIRVHSTVYNEYLDIDSSVSRCITRYLLRRFK